MPVLNGRWLLPIVSHGLAVDLLWAVPWIDHWMRRARRANG